MKTALFAALTAILGIILGMVVVYGFKVMPLQQRARDADKLLIRLQVEADAASSQHPGFRSVSSNAETIRQTLAAD